MASGDHRNTSREDTGPSKSQSSRSKKDRAKTGKAGSSKKMTQKEQSERFKATARTLEADESGKAFERVIARLFPKKPDGD